MIKVYDILGNEIATLMNEEKSVGTYELSWDAEDLPSGVYFYQLKASAFRQAEKLEIYSNEEDDSNEIIFSLW